MRLAEGTRRARERRHRIGHRLERRCGSDGQLVRQPAPDEAEPGDRIVGALDLIGILLGDHDTEVADILCRLPQRAGVDPRDGDAAFLAEQLTGNRGALGGRHEVQDRLVDPPDALVERQSEQRRGRETEPLERGDGRPGPGGRLAEPARQILGRLLDTRHRDTGQLAGTLEHLDARDRGAQRLGELGLGVDDLQARADHRRGTGGERRGSGGSGDLQPAIEGRDAGVGGLHLPRQPPHAALAGLADALQLGPDLAAADDGEADGYAFFNHRAQP